MNPGKTSCLYPSCAPLSISAKLFYMRFKIFKNKNESNCKESCIVKEKKELNVNTQYLSFRKSFNFNVFFPAAFLFLVGVL